jgi:hypothetical protein
MGNSLDAGKVIFIVVAAILAVSLVAYGVLRVTVFTEDAKGHMTMTDAEFNQQWKRYPTNGIINGADLNPFIDAIATSNLQNKDDPTKLIDLCYQARETDPFTIIASTVKSPRVNEMKQIKSVFVSRHGYYIDFITSEKTGNISGIVIKYTKNSAYDFTPNEK